jgi:tRNA (guanine-N7-)-methyltransferase
MTPGQQRSYDEHWADWGLSHDAGLIDFDKVFGGSGRRVLEIGFGMGDSLAQMAREAPQTQFVGIEVHRPGVGRLFHSLAQQGLTNVRAYCHDAVEVLNDCIAPDSLDCIQVFFPDPWHKKRHNKRRLIQAPFVELLVSRLKPGGTVHLATDWEPYAEQMLEVLEQSPQLRNASDEGGYHPRPPWRPLTKFEQRGERLGHGVWDLIFERAR